MIDNRNLLQICPRPGATPTSTYKWLEVVHEECTFRRYLPAGPLPDGGVREHDLVQFFSLDGGLRTVRLDQLSILPEVQHSKKKPKPDTSKIRRGGRNR